MRTRHSSDTSRKLCPDLNTQVAHAFSSAVKPGLSDAKRAWLLSVYFQPQTYRLWRHKRTHPMLVLPVISSYMLLVWSLHTHATVCQQLASSSKKAFNQRGGTVNGITAQASLLSSVGRVDHSTQYCIAALYNQCLTCVLRT